LLKESTKSIAESLKSAVLKRKPTPKRQSKKAVGKTAAKTPPKNKPTNAKNSPADCSQPEKRKVGRPKSQSSRTSKASKKKASGTNKSPGPKKRKVDEIPENVTAGVLANIDEVVDLSSHVEEVTIENVIE